MKFIDDKTLAELENTVEVIKQSNVTGAMCEMDSKSASHISCPWVTVFLPDGVTMKVVRYDHFVNKLVKKQDWDATLAHAGLGLTSDAGEVADVIKRQINYGAKHMPDGTSFFDAMKEELGDVMWYVQLTMNLYGLTWQDVLQHNANKLGKRYVGLQFSAEASGARADKIAEAKE